MTAAPDDRQNYEARALLCTAMHFHIHIIKPLIIKYTHISKFVLIYVYFIRFSITYSEMCFQKTTYKNFFFKVLIFVTFEVIVSVSLKNNNIKKMVK